MQSGSEGVVEEGIGWGFKGGRVRLRILWKRSGSGRIARACSWVYGCDSVVGNVAEWRNKQCKFFFRVTKRGHGRYSQKVFIFTD